MGRQKIRIIDGVEHVISRWTRSCTGCCEIGENGSGASDYPFDEKARCHIGAGCSECGYTGKRRVEMWVPKHWEFDEVLR